MIPSYCMNTFYDLSQFIYGSTSIENVNSAVCGVNRKAANSRTAIEGSHEIVLWEFSWNFVASVSRKIEIQERRMTFVLNRENAKLAVCDEIQFWLNPIVDYVLYVNVGTRYTEFRYCFRTNDTIQFSLLNILPLNYAIIYQFSAIIYF